jgi:hypothetical protein
VSKSPIFAHFTQTLGGLATIRAFEIEAQVVSEQQVRIDANTKAYLLLNCTNRWLGVRLEFLGGMVLK